MTDIVHVPKPAVSPGMGVTALFLGAIGFGGALGLSQPELGNQLSQGIEPTLLLMLGLLFFEMQLRSVAKGLANLRFMSVAWTANFVGVPLIGLAVASLILPGSPLIYTGLVIYFLAPCTDWFLGFTRMARGDTALGAALLPINLITQLLLLPVWFWLLTRHMGLPDFEAIPSTVLTWFVLPFACAQMLRCAMVHLMHASVFARVSKGVSASVPLVTAALIVQIFASHSRTIAAHSDVLVLVVLAIFVFFVATYVMAEALSRMFGLPYPEQALLAMTTAARNAPLMLAVTAVALPDQPLIYAALVIGMLVEFPHLTALKQVLLTKASRKGADR